MNPKPTATAMQITRMATTAVPSQDWSQLFPPFLSSISLFNCDCDFLFTECEPFARFLEKKGLDVKFDIYGSKAAKEVAHVFHCNLRLDEGEKANKAQADFFLKHIV